MTTEMNRPGAPTFVALEIAVQIVGSLQGVVRNLRRHEASLAKQIFRSASSIAANIGEGNRRQGKDRLYFFRVAAGSAEETRVHLRVAMAWELVRAEDVSAALALIDRQLAVLWRLTH
jgi:four helix bundle protein